jgi:lipoprotein-releasing system ATP-binding protein
VRKAYSVGTPVEVEVLHGIDLTLRQGEFAALIGPSGSGKTTLLNLIGLLDKPGAGRLFITGQEASALGEMEATRLRGRAIGFIFQYHYLLPAFTALENVMMPMLAAQGRVDAAMRERAADLLARVALTR